MIRSKVTLSFLLIFFAFCLGYTQEEIYVIETNGKKVSLPVLHESIKLGNTQDKKERESELSKKESLLGNNESTDEKKPGKKRELRAQELAKKVEDFWKSKLVIRLSYSIPDEWELVTDGFRDNLNQKVYRTKNGKYVFVNYIDENNFTYSSIKSIAKNNITGEEDINQGFQIGDVYFGKQTIGVNSISLVRNMVQIILGGEFPIAFTYDKKYKKPYFGHSYDYELYMEVNGAMANIMDAIEKQNPAPKYDPIKHYKKEDSEELKDYNTRIFNLANNEFIAFTPTDSVLTLVATNADMSEHYNSGHWSSWLLNNQDAYIGFLNSEKNNLYWFNNGSKKKRYYISNSGPGKTINMSFPKDYIDLNVSDYIQDISINGNVVEISLNDDDYIKYSLYAHGIFDGKLKRKGGMFVLKDDNPTFGATSGKFVINQDFTSEFATDYGARRGECIIERGSSLIPYKVLGIASHPVSFYNNIFALEEPLSYLLEKKELDAFILDPTEEHTHTIQDHKLYWKDGEKYEAQKKLEERKALMAKQKPLYEALCKKYGKKYVDAAMNGDVINGMPLGLIKEVFETEIWHNWSDGSQCYHVWVRPAVYIEALNKISAKRETNIFYPLSERLIWIDNGRVSSITYY